LRYATGMASQITHILVGERALRQAAPALADRYLDENGAWFRIGCQGPDLFYHNQRTRPLALHYGSRLHRRGFGHFIAALATKGGPPEPGSAWAAFALGFATHGAVDRLTHPYIVYRAGWADPARPETAAYAGCHPFLERILDVLLWERWTGSPVRDFHQARTLVPAGGVPVTFIDSIAAALVESYPEAAGADPLLAKRVANAFDDSFHLWSASDPSRTSFRSGDPCGYEHLDDERGPRSVALVYPEDFDREPDWLNDGRSPWFHPCEPERRYVASWTDLCDEAVRTAAVVVRAVLEAMGASAANAASASNDRLAEAAGQGTLNVGDAQGRQCRPSRADPFPLPEVMQEQFGRRLAQARALAARRHD